MSKIQNLPVTQVSGRLVGPKWFYEMAPISTMGKPNKVPGILRNTGAHTHRWFYAPVKK